MYVNKKVTRRSFIGTTAIVGAITASQLACFSAHGGSTTKPNILLIMPDQQRGDCLSILGHPAIETPQLDKLAAEGVLFRRAYTPVASCMAARYALLTGMSPQLSGVVGYGQQKTIITQTLPGALTNAGYSTALIGRNMHQNRASGKCGYQTYSLLNDYYRLLKKVVPGYTSSLQLVKDMGLSRNHWQAKPWPLNDKLHLSKWIVDTSLKWLKEADTKKPFFLTASFIAPHPPLYPPKKYFDKYKNKKLPEIARGDWEKWNTVPKTLKGSGNRILLEGETLSDAQAGYFGLIEHIDTEIGPLIKEFKARSEKAGRPWIIVFTSDHGEMLGDHGYFRKSEPYEGSANIPLIIAGSPALDFKSGSRNYDPVSLEDIMPTLLTLAGVKIPSNVDGVCLVPVLHGQKASVREWLHFEHSPCAGGPGFHALTDGRFKYIWRPRNGEEQLFDLENDLQEKHDLSKNASYAETLALFHNRLVKLLASRPEGFSKDGKLITGCPYSATNKCTPSLN